MNIPLSVLGACLNPLQRAPEGTEWNTICQMSYRLRTDSMQPEESSFLGRGRMCVGPLDPFSLFLRLEDWTAQPNDRTGTSNVLFGGDRHHCRWRWKLWCGPTRCSCGLWACMQKVIIRVILVWLANLKILDGSKHGFLPINGNGTNDHE